MALRPRPSLGSYLEYHGRCIRVTIRVPADLQKAVGATKLKEALPTDSPKLAERLKWDVIARLKRRIEEARSKSQGSSLEAEALLWRSTTPRSPQSEQEALEVAAASYPLEERAEEIEAAHGEVKAQQFFAIATGKATLIDAHIEDWLDESRYTGRTKAAYTLSIRRFREWLSSKELPTTIEAVTRRLAGDYKVHLERTGMHHNTANKDLSGLSLYWAWIDRRGHVRIKNNPWQGVRVEAYRQTPKPEDGGGDKRAFRDNEIKAIIDGLSKHPPSGAGAALPDLCVIAALTGARISEIVELRVRHYDPDKMELFIPGTKTDNASRRIPLHSGLKQIIQRRVTGKSPDDYIFHEVPEQQSEARGRAAPA